jgi:hypothetical protein
MKKNRSQILLLLFCVVVTQFCFYSEARAEGVTAAASPEPTAVPVEKASDPFAFGDFTWLNGNSRQTEFPLDSKYFTGEFTLDTNFVYDFANPKDHTLVGSTNSGRTDEFQVEQLGVGGDFHYNNIRGRLMTQFGMYSTMTPRNDATPSRGQWDLADAYRYVSEAYGGYHWDIWHGINLDVGVFMSYIGLESYYNYENWNYQMSYVSSNTPWFFNGARLQMFPSDRLKVELWLINGWQSYGEANNTPGFGWQILWRPSADVSFVTNEYEGHDTIGNTDRLRFHTDTSFQYRYYENQATSISKAAFSVTLDVGCESGGGVSCVSSSNGNPVQNFIGLMAYNRLWFSKDHYGLTLGGGAITNPGQYLVLVPPINGATASSGATTGNPYFPQSPGDSFRAWDASATFDYMPSQFITFRLEFIHRQANVPYFAGSGGVTPSGGNQGEPGSVVNGFTPDLSGSENRINAAMMVRL